MPEKYQGRTRVRRRIRSLGACGIVQPIRKSRISQPGSDGHDCPMLGVLHEWNLAQSLNHCVVVHQDRRLMLSYLWDRFLKGGRKMELLVRPIARQVLNTTINGAILLNDSRTPD